MSFRNRLTGFFVLIVVVPMVAVGVLTFRLIGDSEQGKADARAVGIATVAGTVYRSASARAQLIAQEIARDPNLSIAAPGPPSALRARLSTFASRAGLARVVVSNGRRTIVDVGDRMAVAPGVATIAANGRQRTAIAVSELTAASYADRIASPGAVVVVRHGTRMLASTAKVPVKRALPTQGSVKVGGVDYRAVTQTFSGFGGPVSVTVLSDISRTSSSAGASELVAGIFIVGFLLLAFSFSVLASRALESQLSRFLEAARRLGGGDFSSPIPTEGRDEFAALGEEFNSMSSQLERRLTELAQERARLQESIHRIGQTFASNLDRPALLELALQTAMDAVQGSAGRVSSRTHSDQPLEEALRIGSLAGLEDCVYDAERAALSSRGIGEARNGDVSVTSVALTPVEPHERAHGLITVSRNGRPLTDNDRDVLRSLASQATLALENVDLHHQVQRQAVTDELTGLANHRRFQEILSTEIEQVRRYSHPVGLIMLDVDDFKSVNDTHGHPQGDVVLRAVAHVVRENSREVDTAARYGGEEMALILPHTDLEGSYAIAERVREAIQDLRITRLDHHGFLRVTASIGVASSSDGDKNALIAAADAALYEAKRGGKNRTVRAPAQTPNPVGSE